MSKKLKPSDLVSETWISNYETKTKAAEFKPVQAIVTNIYEYPVDFDKRLLLARLIAEEASELIRALGISAQINIPTIGCTKITPSLPHIIDGVVDLVYVATGALVACGVPDIPHQREVNKANENKMCPAPIFDRITGKFLKPEGWKGPDHESIQDRVLSSPLVSCPKDLMRPYLEEL